MVLGIFAYRVLALAGLALIIWTLPRLARRCGVDVGLALWLGVGNPLVLFHLISGVHNESLMIGLMLAGIEVGLRAGTRVLDPHLLGGAFLIVCASAVKLPALLVLGFLGLHWARLRGGRVRDVAVAAGVLTAVAVVVYTPLSVGTGRRARLDHHARGAHADPVAGCRSRTDLGLVGGQVGILGGLGDHTDAVLSLFRGVGLAIAAAALRAAAAGRSTAAGSTRSPAWRRGWARSCCSGPSCTPGTCCGA